MKNPLYKKSKIIDTNKLIGSRRNYFNGTLWKTSSRLFKNNFNIFVTEMAKTSGGAPTEYSAAAAGGAPTILTIGGGGAKWLKMGRRRGAAAHGPNP